MKTADAASSPPDRQWPSRSIAGPDVMVALQNSLPVALIATPRRELSICRSDETVAEVIRRNNEGFDHLPVIDGSRNERERIIGLIELVKFTDGRSAVELGTRPYGSAHRGQPYRRGCRHSHLCEIRRQSSLPTSAVWSRSHRPREPLRPSALARSRRAVRIDHAVRDGNDGGHTQGVRPFGRLEGSIVRRTTAKAHAKGE